MYRVTFHHCWCLHLRVMLFVMNELCRIEQWLSKGRSFALSTKAAVSSTSQRVQLMDRLVILGGSQQECIEACWSGSCCWKQVHCLSSVSLYLVNTKVKVCSLTEERVFFFLYIRKKVPVWLESFRCHWSSAEHPHMYSLFCFLRMFLLLWLKEEALIQTFSEDVMSISTVIQHFV